MSLSRSRRSGQGVQGFRVEVGGVGFVGMSSSTAGFSVFRPPAALMRGAIDKHHAFHREAFVFELGCFEQKAAMPDAFDSSVTPPRP